jgi:hypothetical protein
LKKILNITCSLRNVQLFLYLSNDFVIFLPKNSSLLHYILSSTFTDISLSFIVSLIHIEDNQLSQIIDITVTSFDSSNYQTKYFTQHPAIFPKTYKAHYLEHGHIDMIIAKGANLPQIMLNTLFWTR